MYLFFRSILVGPDQLQWILVKKKNHTQQQRKQKRKAAHKREQIMRSCTADGP